MRNQTGFSSSNRHPGRYCARPFSSTLRLPYPSSGNMSPYVTELLLSADVGVGSLGEDALHEAVRQVLAAPGAWPPPDFATVGPQNDLYCNGIATGFRGRPHSAPTPA